MCLRRTVAAPLAASAIRLAAGLGALCASPASPLLAQRGVGGVTGTVSDDSHRVLAGAEVRLDSLTGAEVSTARDGIFRIAGVGSGSHHLLVRYIGFQPETLSVTIETGRLVHADVAMRHPIPQLEAIQVEGQIAGQAAALNQQRSADNVSSVVDAELVGRLPDRNLAEALARVPGVALVRDQGEGRYVQIRGMDASLNTLSIDGMRMPSPEQGARQTPMDVIPSDMVASIKVNKTLTPDRDADAIGGNVDLVTRTARPGTPLFSFSAAGGNNQVNRGGIKNYTGYVGRRFGTNSQLGAIVGGSYYQNDRGSQNFEQGWCVETTCKGVAADQTLNAPTQLALRDYSQVLRTRRGGNGTLDYRFNDNNALTLKGFYSKFSDDEQRFVTLATFSSGTYALTDENHGTVTGGRMDKEIRLRPVSQTQRSLQLSGTHQLPSSTQLTYTAQMARATEDRPRTLTMLFRQSSMNFTYDVSDEDRPHYTVTKGAEIDSTKFAYNSLRQQTRHVTDRENGGRVDVVHPLTMGAISGFFKAGVSARGKHRESADTSNRFLNSFKAGMPAPTAPLSLASVEGVSRTGHYLDGSYTFGPQASASAVNTLWNSYSGSFTQDVPRSNVESSSGYYKIGEDVYAAYVMGTFDRGPFHLIPGMRLEDTRQTTTGNMVTQAGTTVTVTPQTRTKTYSNLFPSVTGRWTIDARTQLRAAATRSLVRPAFNFMAPSTSIPDGTGVVASLGNAELRPTRALNADLMIEHYFNTVGFISGGVFHKQLDDFIFQAQRPATTADNLGATVLTVSQPINGATGKLNGFEVAWQQNMTFLPGPLSGLGVNANYTKTSSSATLPTREGATSRLPGQAGNAANLGVFYEVGRLSLRGGYNLSDSYLEVVGSGPETDIYVAARNQLDVSGGFRFSARAQLFVETNNLTNQPLRRYEGRPERGWAPANEYYRSWGMIGLRIQP